jgi:pimeloyl-ACP methyl ester carboxylesterase
MERAIEGRLAMPVLVVWGIKDHALGEELLVGVDKYVEEGELRVVTIEDASHWVQVDARKETCDLLWRLAVQVRMRGAGKGGEAGKAGGEGGEGKVASSNL